MHNGEPYISQSSVTAALDTLIYPSKAVEPNPLERLLLVDLFISDPTLPFSEHIREFALHHILVSHMTNELTAKRAVLNLFPPPEHENQEAAEQAIREAARTRSAELLLWTLLYYRYVRADLPLDQEHISQLISVNPRSLRRYYQYALRLLTKRLLREEWAARSENHRQKLYAALPHNVPLKLIGRDALLQKAWTELTSCSLCHIYITGASGVGKTTFAEALIRRLIDTDRLERVVWLDAPPSCEYINHYLIDILAHTGLSQRDYICRYPTALVIDNAEHLLQHPQALTELLRELSAAVIVLTSSAYTPLLEVSLHIALSDLDEESTFTLIHELAQSYLSELQEEDIAPWIWQQIGGNPLGMKIAMSRLAYDETEDIALIASEQTVGRAFQRLGYHARLCCCALSLLPNASLEELRSLWSDCIRPTAMSDLLRFFLVEQSGDNYRLTTRAANYVRQQYSKNEQIRVLYKELFSEFTAETHRAADVVEQILVNRWLSPDERLWWIAKHWRKGLERGHFAQWCTFLEEVADSSPELSMAYGVCLRRVGEWNAARKAFQQAVQQSGRKGDFPTQSAVLLEWAILARLQGDYMNAVALLDQAERCNVYMDEALLQSIQIERSQISLDKGDGAAALELLQNITESLDGAILASEAFLLLGDAEDCRLSALLALEHAMEDRRIEASLHTLIAHSYSAQQQYETAWSYFGLALTILESSEDISAIARAQTNLAAALLKLGKSQRAQELLDRAEPVLSILKDKVGHHAALHNQRLTDIYRANLI